MSFDDVLLAHLQANISYQNTYTYLNLLALKYVHFIAIRLGAIMTRGKVSLVDNNFHHSTCERWHEARFFLSQFIYTEIFSSGEYVYAKYAHRREWKNRCRTLQ